MSGIFPATGDFVWKPSLDYTKRCHLKRFMQQHGIDTYADLQERSTRDISWFTDAMIQYLDIRFQRPYRQVVDLSPGIQRPRWCVDGRLNIVYNCVDKWAADPSSQNRSAIIWEGEEGTRQTLSYGELEREVNRCANALRSLGLGKGDGVGLFMPMTPEICIALLATAKIGAVILPLFSGYGVGAIVSRLADAGAKALVTADGLLRRSQIVPLKPIADKAAEEVQSLKHLIVLKRVGNDVSFVPGRDSWWHELIPRQTDRASLEDTAAEDLLMVMYTSGTTGKPKGAVHTHCSFPIKAAQDMALGTDVQKEDVIHWVTDMGWMMGPWLLFGATVLGGTCLISDGAPDFPNPTRIWEMADHHRISVLGVSPSLVRSLKPFGNEFVRRYNLSSLRLFASTGEPWDPESWNWLFQSVGEGKRPIINYSGGTEVAGGILMGNPLLPLKPTAFSAPCPGMAADVVDSEGCSLRNGVGELVIRLPWIGMTRGFWKDDKRYLDTYWSRFPNLWVHGDWAAIDQDGMWYILGRSDDTIKVAGRRIGPAEVESVLVNHPAVIEAAAIGVPHKIKGNELICFCVLAEGHTPSPVLKSELQAAVAGELGKPLQPKEIWFFEDLPKTRNAKIMRRVIRSAYLHEDPGDISTLVNPEIVDQISQAGSHCSSDSGQ